MKLFKAYLNLQKAFVVAMLVLVGVSIVTVGIFVFDTFELKQVTLHDPRTYLNISMLLNINFIIFFGIVLYLDILFIYMSVKKKIRIPEKVHTEKRPLIQRLIKALPVMILSGISIVLASYPILILVAFEYSDYIGYLPITDYVFISINALLMPLSASIIAIVAFFWKRFWLTKLTLLYALVLLTNGLFLLAFLLIPEVEVMIA